MEELLNKLIEKGWKVFGRNYCKYKNGCLYYIVTEDGVWSEGRYGVSLRDLVSKESGLWQFVCENGMIRLTEYYGVCNWIFGENIYYDESATEKFYTDKNYEYRLIESSLKDESELEEFLLQNIKIEGND